MDETQLRNESRLEIEVRDHDAVHGAASADDSPESLSEMESTLEALQPAADTSILEVGCGTGRFTRRLAALGNRVLAVDFSRESLGRLASRLDPSWCVGLVHADCAHFEAAPRFADRVLSTLVSNLPDADARASMLRLAATALRDGGRLVFSTHNFGVRARLAGVPQSGRYRPGGIYRYLFRREEIRAETERFFGRVSGKPIVIVLPLARRFGVPLLPTSRFARHIPLAGGFGELLLVVAENPQRP
jgi:SAM-dependent methyltransferase